MSPPVEGLDLEPLARALGEYMRVDRRLKVKARVEGPRDISLEGDVDESPTSVWMAACRFLIHRTEADPYISGDARLDPMATFLRIRTRRGQGYFPVSSALSSMMGGLGLYPSARRTGPARVYVVPMHVVRMMCRDLAAGGMYCRPSVTDIINMPAGVGVMSFSESGNAPESIAVLNKADGASMRLDAFCCPQDPNRFTAGVARAAAGLGSTHVLFPGGRRVHVDMLASASSVVPEVVFDVGAPRDEPVGSYEREAHRRANDLMISRLTKRHRRR
jgi:hypothetical protein